MSINKDNLSDIVVKILFIAPIVFLAGLAFLLGMQSAQKSQENELSSIPAQEQSKIITLEQANAYVGRTLKDFCAEYGDYINVHTFSFGEKYGGGGTPCEEVGKGYYYDGFIISQAYYDEEYLNSDEYKGLRDYCDEAGSKPSICDKPLQVYVDSMPEYEAREAGIQIK